MARKGWKQVNISRREARLLAEWLRDRVSRFQPTALGGSTREEYEARWRPVIAALDRCGRRAASGRPSLPSAFVAQLSGLADALVIDRGPYEICRVLWRIRSGIRRVGRPAYASSDDWSKAALRTKRGATASDAERLARKQRKKARDAAAWERWSQRVADAGQTALTATIPTPGHPMPAPRKNRRN